MTAIITSIINHYLSLTTPGACQTRIGRATSPRNPLPRMGNWEWASRAQFPNKETHLNDDLSLGVSVSAPSVIKAIVAIAPP